MKVQIDAFDVLYLDYWGLEAAVSSWACDYWAMTLETDPLCGLLAA